MSYHTDSGNTATQVSPAVSESEVEQVRNVFQRMADSVTQASLLAKDVAELRLNVNALQADVNSYRTRLQEQDGIIASLRSQRDDALSEAETAKRDLSIARIDLSTMTEQVNVGRTALSNAIADLEATKKERDDWHLRVMELEEENAKTREALEKITNVLGSLAPKPTKIEDLPNPLPPKAEPVNEAPKPVEQPYSAYDHTWR